MLLRIWQVLSQAPSVASCRKALWEGDVASARSHYRKFENSQVPRLVAIGARIALIERDSQRAKALFEKAANLARTRKRTSNRYVFEYCSYWLSIISEDGRHEAHRRNALDLHVSYTVRDSLPLPSTDLLANPDAGEHA